MANPVVDPSALTQRLNRHAPKGARVSFVDERPFDARSALRRYRFANGLAVLTLADPRSSVTSFQTWFRIGSRDEEDGATGIAHFFAGRKNT